MNLACITVYWCILNKPLHVRRSFHLFAGKRNFDALYKQFWILMHFTSSLEFWCSLPAAWKFDVLCKQPGFSMYSARKIKCWCILQIRWTFVYYCKPDGSLMHFAGKTYILWIFARRNFNELQSQRNIDSHWMKDEHLMYFAARHYIDVF